MIPGLVLTYVKGTPDIELSGLTTEERECQGAKFHSPRPMIVHPFTWRRADGEDEIVYLCGTCTDNVQVLLALLKGRQGFVPWSVKRCFGNLVRSVAEQAYAHLSEGTDHA